MKHASIDSVNVTKKQAADSYKVLVPQSPNASITIGHHYHGLPHWFIGICRWKAKILIGSAELWPMRLTWHMDKIGLLEATAGTSNCKMDVKSKHFQILKIE